jgi:hypothetical protein
MAGEGMDGTEDRAMVAFATAVGSRLRGTVATEVRDRQAAAAAAAAAASHSALRRLFGPGRSAPVSLALAAGLVGLVVIGGLGGIGTLGRDPLPLIAVGGAGGGAPMSATAPAAERSGDPAPGDMTRPAEMPSDLSIWRPTLFRFELADGVRADGDGGDAWTFEAPQDVARAARDLAAVFGLPAPRPAEWGDGSYVAEGPDGTTLSIARSGDWYFAAPADAWPQWSCRPSAARDGSEDCSAPAPAVGLPSDAEVERLALDLLARAGVTGVRRTEGGYRDDWSVSFAGEVALPGGPVGLGAAAYVTFGAEGRVLSATATLARPVALGRYPTVDVAAAVARLQAQMEAPVQAVPYPAVEPDGPGRSSEVPLPAPAGDPEVVEVRIIAAERVSSWAWTPEGRMLVVPHYRLRDAEGGEWWVVAVEDRYLSR